MFFKTKCPRCGAKNDKARTACIECGAPLALEQAEEQLAPVSTEGEMQAKWEAEKAPKERAEDEYRGNEKVLVKARGERKIHRKGWFWTGVGLLSGGGFWWVVFAFGILQKEPDAAIVSPIAGLLTGIGAYCLRRGRKPTVAEEKVGGPIY